MNTSLVSTSASPEPKQFLKVVSYSTFQSSHGDLVDVQGSYRFYDLDGSDAVERENTTVSGRVTRSNVGRIPSLFQVHGHKHKSEKVHQINNFNR